MCLFDWRIYERSDRPKICCFFIFVSNNVETYLFSCLPILHFTYSSSERIMKLADINVPCGVCAQRKSLRNGIVYSHSRHVDACKKNARIECS
jgi:hypothetical protein